MMLKALQEVLAHHPTTFPRFVLPDGEYIPSHAHVTEVGHVLRNYIDCGGETGREEKVLLQTHVGSDLQHRLRSDQFGKILELGRRVIPDDELEVEVEYDGCIVSQYPISDARVEGEHLDFQLTRNQTQCRAQEWRGEAKKETCCGPVAACCEWPTT